MAFVMILIVLTIYLASGAIECWDKVCLSTAIGDKFCDTNCMTKNCKFDNKSTTIKNSDCYNSCLSNNCRSTYLGNSQCNSGIM